MHDLESLPTNPDEGPFLDLHLNDAVLRCATHVRLQLGGKPKFTERPAELEGINLVLDGQMKNLKDFIDYIHNSITALKDSQGGGVISSAPTLPQIWAKYGTAPDLDSAKLYAIGVHRHNVDAVSKILGNLEVMLDENCKHLEKLKSSLSLVRPEEIGDGAQDEVETADTEMTEATN